MPDGGYALSGLQGPLTGTYPVGPRRRSAAGQDIRHGTCNFAGWRLSPCPAYRVLSQAHTSQARAGAAPPGKISGTVPVISPGGGCRLTRPTESSHRLIPRRPAQAQRPPGKISDTVPVISPGGGYALPGLQSPLTGSNLSGPRKRSAAG